MATNCESKCAFTEIPEGAVHGVINDAVTVIRGCSTQWIMYSLTPFAIENENSSWISTFANGSAITFKQLRSEFDASSKTDIGSMWIGASDYVSVSASQCWSDQIQNGETMAGYIEFSDIDEDYYWTFESSAWFMMVSLVMALFFIFNEWLFYSYNEIMIPGKDHRAYLWWYSMRIAWLSFMFTVLIAHSLMVDDEIGFMIGQFEYRYLEVDGFIATAFVGLCLLVCLCCCCFNESMCI